MYYWLTGIAITILLTILFRKLHPAAAAAIAAVTSCIVLTIGNAVFEGGSNLWPLSFVLYGVPLFIGGLALTMIFRNYTKRS